MRKTRQQTFEENCESLNAQIEAGRQFSEEADENTIVNNILNSEIITSAHKTLNSLRQPDKEIFIMHSEGLTQIQIGELTHRTQVYVSRSIKRTRVKILKNLGNEYL